MHPAARAFMGLFALWTMLKLALLVVGLERNRRHLQEAAPEVRATLGKRLIGGYGTVALNVLVLAIAVIATVRGSFAFVRDWGAGLVVVASLAGVAAVIGVKAAFESVFNPAVDEFDRRLRTTPFRRLGRRGDT